jgi:hypothetical protein
MGVVVDDVDAERARIERLAQSTGLPLPELAAAAAAAMAVLRQAAPEVVAQAVEVPQVREPPTLEAAAVAAVPEIAVLEVPAS